MRTTLMILATALIATTFIGCSGQTSRTPAQVYLDTITDTHAMPAETDMAEDADAVSETATAEAAAEDDGWQPLFDGESLEGWTATQFGGEGEVSVEDSQVMLGFAGNGLTGITWQDGEALPRSNYEIALQAKRVDGNDFFCGLTFPVGDSYCSLIVGGWGGTVVGLSSLDGFDASENDTTTLMTFETGRWYDIRLRVLDDRIEAWIDDEQVVDIDPNNYRIDIRWEVNQSRPLGIAAWNTTAALRDIRMRELD